MGYNNSEDYYWLKIKNECKIIPYIELELKLIISDENNTNIIFIAKTNNLFTKQREIMNKIVKKFIEKFASNMCIIMSQI
jgi:capsular polysaccharide biosynthesis protein